jgi:hypothetical protein
MLVSISDNYKLRILITHGNFDYVHFSNDFNNDLILSAAILILLMY